MLFFHKLSKIQSALPHVKSTDVLPQCPPLLSLTLGDPPLRISATERSVTPTIHPASGSFKAAAASLNMTGEKLRGRNPGATELHTVPNRDAGSYKATYIPYFRALGTSALPSATKFPSTLRVHMLVDLPATLQGDFKIAPNICGMVSVI